MKISVIIIARNEEKRIGKTLKSLREQTLLPDEIIVVDNASTDATAKTAEEYGATVVHEPTPVRGKARNTGFLASKGKFVALSDADFILDHSWLESLYKRINVNEKIGGVSGNLLALNSEKLIPRLIELSSEKPRIGNAVMMYRRKAVLEAGLWNPRLHVAEDIELAQRIHKKGYVLTYEPKAKVYHPWPEKLAIFLEKQFKYGYWSMLAKKSENALTRKEWLLMFTFPFIFIKHAPKIRVHPLLPFFLTLTTYAYTLGMWNRLLSGRLK